MEKQIDMAKNILTNEHEFKIIYKGNSFDGKMEISDLTSQLKSVENLLVEIVKEYYDQRNIKNSGDLEVYVKLKKSSFAEWISVISPIDIIKDTIPICLGALFTYFLINKDKKDKDKKEIPKAPIDIKKIVNNIKVVENITHIITPLKDSTDSVIIVSSENPEAYVTIKIDDKKVFLDCLAELKAGKIIKEYSEEEKFGKLMDVTRSKNKHKYGFVLDETSKAISTLFRKDLSETDLKEIFIDRLKILANVCREDGEIREIEIISWEKSPIKKITLNEFSS